MPEQPTLTAPSIPFVPYEQTPAYYPVAQPAFYARQFSPFAEVRNSYSTGTSEEVANRCRDELTADRCTEEPSTYWQCSAVANARYVVGGQGLDRRWWDLQIYTVQKGTHVHKRLVKARDHDRGGAFRAIAFLNRDGSLTKWNNSPLRDESLLFRMAEKTVWLARVDGGAAEVQSTDTDNGELFKIYSVQDTCRVCNRDSAEADQQFCIRHFPNRPVSHLSTTGDAVFPYDVEIHGWQQFNSWFGDEDRSLVLPYDVNGNILASTRHPFVARNISYDELPTGMVLAEVLHTVAGMPPRQTSAEREAARIQEQLESFQPLLSEVDGRQIR